MKEYYRSTIIQAKTKVRRERLLPKNGEVVAQVGQEVTPAQVMARAPLETTFHIVPVSDELDVAPAELNDHLQVEMGMMLEMGTVLAEKKRLLGRKQVLSPVDGVLFDIVNGRIIIQQTADWLELRAMVAGRVVNYMTNRGVIIETSGGLIQGVWGSGKENYGKLHMLSRTPDAPMTIDQLTADTTGTIVIVGRLDQLDVLQKAEDTGIRGLIAGSMPASLCRASQEVSFPIILTDGVGNLGMNPAVYNLLAEAEAQEASLFAQYDAKLGHRPEIVIPVKGPRGLDSVPTSGPLAVGQTVRILCAPYAGETGKVVKLYSLAQTTSLGTKAHGADIQLTDDAVVFVPNANFDVIL